MHKILFLFGLLFLSTPALTAIDCENGLMSEDMPTLAGGRVKPYYVLARETFKFLEGKPKDSLTRFCKLSLGKDESQVPVSILIEHVDTKKLLGLSQSEKSIPAQELVLKKELMRAEAMKLKENNSYKKDLNKTFNRLITYEKLIQGEAFHVYGMIDGNMDWHIFKNYLTLESEDLTEAIQNSKQMYIQQNNDTYLLELTYFKSHIFDIAMLVALLGIFVIVLSKNLTWGIIFASATIVIELIGLTMRVIISGRAPITNMYETVLFSGFGALLIALIILFFRKEKTFLLAGLGYNILCLFMMKFANNMLSSSISPLVPVLRDNFWLSTHVTTIILSYAALALSWLVANITLIKLRLGKLSKAEYRYNEGLTYTCIKIGVVLLAAGIILGGVWADYSWGRFWGWDPKETWSLIVLLFYMALLHGKYTSWINTHRFVMATAAGFMTVMMAWFGVNYILASGLHSYGFSEGGAVFLGSFFLIQTFIIIVCGVKFRYSNEA
ncbi:MAG: hypothetical protein CME62_05920 [Halobacteriovoraceae bacterium]|nr:hypothetical protein [Halobacteriovoraceae bacterium]|tara:strand:- start:356 stop:1846 length:1491 start_codon:yes stop_codon:yes gene_type:complete